MHPMQGHDLNTDVTWNATQYANNRVTEMPEQLLTGAQYRRDQSHRALTFL